MTQNWDLVEKARVVYCTGFFITVSPASIAAVASHCAANDKIYCMVRITLFVLILGEGLG